jgi:hypothetical protein
MSKTNLLAVGCWLLAVGWAHCVIQLDGRLQGRFELLKCAAAEPVDAISQPDAIVWKRKR